MPNRIIPGQKFYTAGTGIEIDDDKVISLKLRDENNLIFVNENNEVYVDLQLPDGIEPTDAFPVGVTTGRVLVGDGRDKTGTIISAKTTSGDEIKVLYADDGTLRLDNGTGTFKQVYFKADVDAIVQAIWDYIYANCNTKTFYTGTYDVNLAQAVYDWISQGNFGIVYFNPVSGIKRDVIFPPTTTETGTISSWSYTDVRQATGGMFYEDLITLEFGVSDGVATTGINSNGTVVHNDGRIILSDSVAPSNPIVGTTWYDTTSNTMKIWNGTAWQSVGGGDVLVSDQANNIFTPGMKIWGGTESDYQSLTPDSNTAYLLLAGGPTPPTPSVISCDFTQSDEGFTYYNTPNDYGRDSNGFYIKSTESWGDVLALIIPQTIIDMGTPKMIKLYGKNMNNNAGLGISEGTDTQFARCFNGVINLSPSWGTPNNTGVSASAEDILVLDFDNEICYLESVPGTTATLYSSTILNDWGNGMNLCVLSPNSSNYGYLTKAEFYF